MPNANDIKISQGIAPADQYIASYQNEGFKNARKNNYKGQLYEWQERPGDQYNQELGKAAGILQGGFSSQGDATTNLQDSLRSAAMKRLENVPNMAQQQKQSLQTELEKGFANQAAQLRRTAAGTGAGASLGYGRAAGDLANSFQQNLSKGLLDIDSNAAANEAQVLGQLGDVGQQLFSQQAAERALQYGQAQDLSELYNQFAQKEGGRADEASANAAAATAARKQAQNSLISSILGLGGQVAGAKIGQGKW